MPQRTFAWEHPTHGPNRQPTPSHMAPDIVILLDGASGPLHFGPFVSAEVAQCAIDRVRETEVQRGVSEDRRLRLSVTTLDSLRCPASQRPQRGEQLDQHISRRLQARA